MTAIDDYARRHPHYHDDAIPRLLASCLEGAGTVLEAGCGDGTLLAALSRAGLLDGKRVLAVNLSPVRIELVRGLGLGIEATVDDVETLATVRGPVDLAISTQVIEHVDDERMVAALARVIRPGGTLYLSTVYKKWYGWYFYRNRGRWVLDPTHLREYREDGELTGKLRASGFEVLESRKRPFAYPIMDLALRAFRVGDRGVYENGLLRALRRVKLPIVGYFEWELLARRV